MQKLKKLCLIGRSIHLHHLPSHTWHGIAAVLAITVLTSGCDQLFGPNSFDDCILENMRGVNNNSAAAKISRSCREKFPESLENEAKSHQLKPEEVSAITGRAGLGYGTLYSGKLYNGNEGVTVTQVQVQVTTKEDGKEVSRVYTTDITLPPQTAKDFGFNIIVGDQGSVDSWMLIGAKGF